MLNLSLETFGQLKDANSIKSGYYKNVTGFIYFTEFICFKLRQKRYLSIWMKYHQQYEFQCNVTKYKS